MTHRAKNWNKKFTSRYVVLSPFHLFSLQCS